MNQDWLLELLGIRPRQSEARTTPDGTYVQPEEERQQQRQEYMNRIEAPPPAPTSDLMTIVNRQRENPTPAPSVDAALAPMAGRAEQQQSAIQAGQQRLRDLEAEMAQEAERQQMRTNLNPGRTPPPAPSRPAVANGGSMPAAPLHAPAPGPAPTDPFNQPMNPAYAAAERAGPPLAHVGPAGPSGPPVNLAANPPAYTNGGGMPNAPLPPMPPVTHGPFMTMSPGDPMQEAFVGANGVPVAPPMNPTGTPPPDPNYLLPGRQPPHNYVPFSEPSASRTLRGTPEGMPIIDGSQPNPGPFMPAGQLTDWWNSGRGPTPTQARSIPQRPLPTPAPAAPDQSTILNQQELARFLAADSGASPPPPAPATTPPGPLASVPPVAPTPVPPGATPMTPAAPPSPGSQIPLALQEQLLQEAYRLVANKGAQQPTLGAR